MASLKARLRAREPVAGMHVSLVDACITELCGQAGFDFIWIDTEHTAIDHHVLLQHVIAAKAAGTDSLVRVAWNDPVQTKRVLEMGPTGIVFPMVSTPEDLDRAMRSTVYPPYGTRGFGPIRANRYGHDSEEDYLREANTSLVRCVQIETATAVERLPEMAKNPWVDCFVIGPYDLSASIGELGDVFGENTSRLVERTVAVLTAAGKSIGVSTASDDPKVLRHWHDKGINFISAGTDFVHVTNGARAVRRMLKEIQGS
jgi:2-dehydro-3-deoxyglucarate aldolase/4-hydroxy-2-oxoheptanedioate aldolase